MTASVLCHMDHVFNFNFCFEVTFDTLFNKFSFLLRIELRQNFAILVYFISLTLIMEFDKIVTKAGRPKTKIEINFNEPLKNFEQIKRLAQLDDMKILLKEFGIAILELFKDDEVDIDDESQTPAEIITEVFHQIPLDHHEVMVEPICEFIDKMNLENQTKLYSKLGLSLNKVLYEISDNETSSDLNLADLMNYKKEAFYESLDPRLKAFVDSITEKSGNRKNNHDNKNFKINAVENLMKARNNNHVSVSGVREHIVAYLSSGKSRHVTQLFSKQGPKGSRPLLENILENSMEVFKFEAPQDKSVFISFDNIQKLYKNYRLGVSENKKPYCCSCNKYPLHYA